MDDATLAKWLREELPAMVQLCEELFATPTFRQTKDALTALVALLGEAYAALADVIARMDPDESGLQREAQARFRAVLAREQDA